MRHLHPFDLILSPSKDEVAALSLPKSLILRQAQDEDFGVTPTPIPYAMALAARARLIAC